MWRPRTRGREVPGHAADPSCRHAEAAPSSVHASTVPQGPGAGPLQHTKPAGTAEGPLLQGEAKASTFGPPHPFPQRSPVPSLAPHHANPHLRPHSGKQRNSLPPDPQMGTNEPSPSCRPWSLFSWPLLTGASGHLQ